MRILQEPATSDPTYPAVVLIAGFVLLVLWLCIKLDTHLFGKDPYQFDSWAD